MANTLYTPEQLASTAIALVTEDLVLAKTLNRDYESDFGGGKGATVNVKKPAVLQAATRALASTVAVTVDDLAQTVVPVALDEQIYNAVQLLDSELSLELEDFGREVLAPQTLAIAEAIEAKVVALFQAVAETAWGTAAGTAYDPTDPRATFVSARKALRDLAVPASGMYAAVGTTIAADLINYLGQPGINGESDALRDATIGRIAGFTVIESNRLAVDEAVFYHKSGATLALRAPSVPAGASFGASASGNGFAMTHIRDYDSDILADRSIVSVFAGAKVMPIVSTAGGGADVTPVLRTVLDGAV